MIQITPGSHAFRIILTLLLTGEFPFRSLRLLGDERTLKAIATRLCKSDTVQFWWIDEPYLGRVIYLSGKGKMKTMRLSKKVFPFIGDVLERDLHQYLCAYPQGHFRGDKTRIDRHHRLAETTAFLMMSGIECSAHLVPQLQVMETLPVDYEEPAFYGSKYLKSLGNDEEKKTQFTRLTGSLFCQSGNYIVYNSRDSVMNWNGQGERKTVQNMETICKCNYYIDPIKSAILLGIDYDIALSTLARYESGDKSVMLSQQGFNHIHFVPMTAEGRKLLQMMMLPNWKDDLLLYLFAEEQLMVGKGSFTYDALVDGVHMLSFLDSDILKLSAFYRTVKGSCYQWAVYCFDFQFYFLTQYLGSMADIRIIDIDEIHRNMGAERRALL